MSDSFWLDYVYEAGPPLTESRTAEAVIIGGGITGVGLARELRKRSIETCLLESGTLAGGATGRNAGFLVSGLGEHYARSVEFWGRRTAASISRLHQRNHALIVEAIAEYAIDCDYRQEGGFVISADAEEEDVLRKSHTLLLEDGFSSEFIDSVRINRFLGTSGFGGGLYIPSDGCVDPVRLVRGTAQACSGNRLRFFENTRVLGVQKHGSSWTVSTGQGSMSTPLLFLACNAWSPVFLPCIQLKPVRGQCLSAGPTEKPVPEVPCYVNYGSEYWRAAGGHLLAGGMRRAGIEEEEAGYGNGISGSVQRALETFILEHFPGFDRVPVKHRWSGIMSYSGDGLPFVGPVPGEEGMYLAAGYTGHGLGWALLAARWLAGLAIDGRDEIPPFCRIDRTLRLSPNLERI